MKLNLIMICLLRSNAAAFATHSSAGIAGGGGVVGSGGGSGCFARRAVSSGLGLFVRGGKRSGSAATTNLPITSSSFSSIHEDKSKSATSMMLCQTPSLDNDVCHDDASSTAAAAAATTSLTTTSSIINGGYIAFRLARRSDVQQIQNCNLATLPENYNANFYVNHMRTWPELTLVAEHIPEGYDIRAEEELSSTDRNSEKITPLSDYIRGRRQRFDDASSSRPQKEIVGYILGKIEERPIVNVPPKQIFPPSKVVPLYNINNGNYFHDNDDDHDEETLLRYLKGQQRQQPRPQLSRPSPTIPLTEKIGHVTSLAVHSHARRLGIATSLLSQLHYHLAECHGAQSVGLHVRISNKAAVRLYCDEGYDVADIIPFYYGDGEDAYFMRKDIKSIAIVEKSELVSKSESRHPMQKQQPPSQPLQRRGEKERNEWLNRDAIRSGSFFEGRKSIRDTQSEEERAWRMKKDISPQSLYTGSSNTMDNTVGSMTGTIGSSRSSINSRNNNLNISPSISGQFRRSFHALIQHQYRDRLDSSSPPPWETGPEELRLPRYKKVVRPSDRQEDPDIDQ